MYYAISLLAGAITALMLVLNGRMNQEVRSATWICTLVYILVGFFGYVAYCTQQFSGELPAAFARVRPPV